MSTKSNRLISLFAVIKYISKLSLINLYSFVICFITSSKSHLILTLFYPKSDKISRPVVKASYSDSLLEHEPSNLNLNFVGMSF